MAESRFDRARFDARLAAAVLGRTLETHAALGSTNDRAWDAWSAGAAHGLVVITDAQNTGRGRAGRTWHTAPGLGLALSVLLVPARALDPRALAIVPLAAGLALARALESLGLAARLKWPNDVLAGDRKVAGILCETRTTPASATAVVAGVGVNVAERDADLAPEVRGSATSLALEGVTASREDVAAELLNRLEPLWSALERGARADVIDAWRAQADFWGSRAVVNGPSGPVAGIARDLDDDGRLVLETADGRRVTVAAGDLALGARTAAAEGSR